MGQALSDIKKTLENTPHKSALLNIFESGFPGAHVKRMIDIIRSALPDLEMAGISLYTMVDMPGGIGVKANLIVFEESGIEVVSMGCGPGEEDAAIGAMRSRLREHPDAKAVELFAFDNGLNVTEFMKGISEGNENIGIFGTITSNSIQGAANIHGLNKYNLFRFSGDHLENNQLIIGDNIYTSGIVAVIFYGSSLKVEINYALGWHPIGREMEIVKGEKGRFGETTVTNIDGMPAVDLYREYLGVCPDENLITNICEFPLMVQRDGVDICLIPCNYGADKELYFSMALNDDDKVRFSFATQGEVLSAMRASLRSLRSFQPEALFLVLCGNRLNFLREEAKLEWEEFGELIPDYALMHGGSELLYKNGAGGVLNSAHLAIGMREGEPETVAERTGETETGRQTVEENSEPDNGNREDGNNAHNQSVIPLAERMSVFLSKMTGQLIEMAEDANAANLAKSAFLSAMSHEIRTPINAILGMDEMILRESNESQVIGYAEDIRSAGNTLLGIVNDVLDFSKIEAGKMDILPVEYELSSVINDLYNVIWKRAEDKGLKLVLDIDPAIPSILYGDEIRIKQIITNILTNAVKYTEEGTVTLKAECRRLGKPVTLDNKPCEVHGTECLRNPMMLIVAVTDTGIGIREEDLKKLSTAFTRVDERRNRTIEGTGLGLNITRRLLSLMGSDLQVESTYGKGSTFSFEIVQGIVRDEPVGEVTERFLRSAAVRRKYKESFTAPSARILVVDDTRMNLDVIVNLLKRTRITVDTVESGMEALEAVKKTAYDAIFLDHRMPNMDGLECFKRMRELNDNISKDAPVIALTANAVSGAREEYLTLGFADYLTKPIDSHKLEEMLIRYLPEDKVNIIKEEDKETGNNRGNSVKEAVSGEAVLKSSEETEAAEVSVEEAIPDWLKKCEDIDTESGIVNCGSTEGYIQILTGFYENIDAKADEIKNLYEEGNYKDYTVKVHALKSSARIVGLTELSQMAEALEAAGDADDTDTICNGTQPLLDKLISYKDVLNGLASDTSDEDLPEAPQAVIDDAYAGIGEFAQIQDYDLTQMVLDSLKEYRLAGKDKENFDRIGDMLYKLDWDGILEVIKYR